MSSVIVEHKNGKKFDLDKLGYRVQMISPFGSNWTQSVLQLNRYTNIVQQPKVQPKTFTITIAMNCSDITGLQLKYEALSMIFNGEYYFYIYLANIPHIRWEVSVSGEPQYTPQGTTGYGTATITLYCAKGFAETTHSTGELGYEIPANQYPLGLFGIGTHFENGGENPVYAVENDTSINIFNPGTIALRAKGLHGIIKCQDGSNLIIENNTNKTRFEYNGSFGVLELDGYMCMVDGKLDYKNTNHGHIDIERGWNSFNVYGATYVSFDLRFYY